MTHTLAVSPVPGSQCDQAEDSIDFWTLGSTTGWLTPCAGLCCVALDRSLLHIHHPSGSAALVSGQQACLMWRDKQSYVLLQTPKLPFNSYSQTQAFQWYLRRIRGAPKSCLGPICISSEFVLETKGTYNELQILTPGKLCAHLWASSSGPLSRVWGTWLSSCRRTHTQHAFPGEDEWYVHMHLAAVSIEVWCWKLPHTWHCVLSDTYLDMNNSTFRPYTAGFRLRLRNLPTSTFAPVFACPGWLCLHVDPWRCVKTAACFTCNGETKTDLSGKTCTVSLIYYSC